MLGFALLAFGWFSSCSKKNPTLPKPSEGVIRGKATDASTLPINGAHINIAYDLGATVTGLPHRVKKPSPGFLLQQSYPNPYQGVTTVEFASPQRAHIVVEVVNGRYPSTIPITLVNDVLQAGQYKVIWSSLLPDSILLTNGKHLYRMTARLSGEIFFEDEFYTFHNDADLKMIIKMQPLVTADVNGQFTIPHALTSIGDTVAVTVSEKPEVQEYRVISDSITVFISSPGYKATKRRLQFRKQDALEMNVVLERQ